MNQNLIETINSAPTQKVSISDIDNANLIDSDEENAPV